MKRAVSQDPGVRRLTTLGACAVLANAAPAVSVLGAIGVGAPSRFGPIWLRAESHDGVALTFDDGPAPETYRILEKLSGLSIRATFFVSGCAVWRHPGIVAEMAERGHQVETHGMNHRHHILHSPAWVHRDLTTSVSLLNESGVIPRFVRPPYGQVALSTLASARRLRLTPVLWSAWGRECARSKDLSVEARVVRNLRPGTIVLLHDSDQHCGPGSVDAVERALPAIAKALDALGLTPRRLDEILR
ncbi:MAG: polysaccharide deacetylase family protein [Acidimicrobiales bacterium]